MATKHAHIVTRVNASKIRTEVIEGEEHWVVPASTLPDGVVMNGGYYSEEEITASYKSLEGTPSPLGHPKVNNEFVTALHPIAINKNGVGAWNRNVERSNGRVNFEKVINKRVAQQTEQGRALSSAIEKQEPIHTSTGLTLKPMVGNGESRGKKYTWVATNMQFDHDCFLLGEPGAATPEEGVGVFVNASQEQAEVMVCNLDLTEGDGYTLEAMAEEIMGMADRAERRERNKGLVDTIVQALKSAIGGAQSSQTTTANAKAPEGDMSLTKEDVISAVNEAMKDRDSKITTLTEQVTTLATNQAKDSETIGKLHANAEAAEAARNAEVDTQLKAAGFDDEDLKGMTANAKQKVLAKQAPAQGFHINAAFGGNADKGPQDTLPE